MDLFKKWVKKLRINPLWDVQLELGIRLVILNCFEDGNYANRLLEQTGEELVKCFLLEYGDNKEFSFGRCKQGKSFNDLLCEKVDKVGSHTESHSVHH